MEKKDLTEPVFAMDYNRDKSVIQANELIRAKQDDLTLLEAKLLRLAIAQILKNDTDVHTYSCKVADLARFLNIDKYNIYKEIQDLSISIMKKSIFILDKSKTEKKGKENYKIFHWVDYVEYTDGTITFKLSESLKPYLVGLDKLFTMYGYDVIIGLPTNNAIRLYELLASYQNITVSNIPYIDKSGITKDDDEFVFSIEWLRKYFNCENKYPNANDFIRRIIDSSIKAIQKKTLMRVTYRTVKFGVKIAYIVFKIHSWIDKEYDKLVKGDSK